MSYERFTESARTAMRCAGGHTEVQRVGAVCPIHMLLGILEGNRTEAVDIIGRFTPVGDFAADALRVAQAIPAFEVTQRAGGQPTESPAPTPSRLPQAPLAKKAVEYALEEARNFNHNFVDSAHLLFGVMRCGDETVDALFRAHNITIELARAAKLAPSDELYLSAAGVAFGKIILELCDGDRERANSVVRLVGENADTQRGVRNALLEFCTPTA